MRSRREFVLFSFLLYLLLRAQTSQIDDAGSWLVQEVRSRLHHQGPSKLNLGLASLCVRVWMFVCEWGSAHPQCVSECSPPALHLQAAWVKDGVRGKAGLYDGRDPAANDGRLVPDGNLSGLSCSCPHLAPTSHPLRFFNDIVCVCLS